MSWAGLRSFSASARPSKYRGGDLDHPAFACERVHDPKYGSRIRRFQGQVKTAKFQTDPLPGRGTVLTIGDEEAARSSPHIVTLEHARNLVAHCVAEWIDEPPAQQDDPMPVR